MKKLHIDFVSSRVKHLCDLHSDFHPKVSLIYSAEKLENLKNKELQSCHFFKMISALTHALEGSIHCGADKLHLTVSGNREHEIQLTIECEGNISDPTESQIQCDRLMSIEETVESLGGEVACIYGPSNMQLEIVLPLISISAKNDSQAQ